MLKYFLQYLSFLTVLFVLPTVVASPTISQRPNIIFIFTDDHAYQAIGAYGSNRNTTPNIDRLAAEGMRFDRCVVTNSICGPSRAVVQTGKYSHKNGFYKNGNKFDNDQQTFPKILRENGYQTAIVGKWHLDCDVQGYDYSEVLIGQGTYYNPLMIRNGKRVQYEGYTTEIITNLTLKWLREGRDKAKPFLLMSQHKAPHREWDPAPKYYERYRNSVFPEPETLFDDFRDRSALLEQYLTIEDLLTPRDGKIAGPPAILNDAQKDDWHKMFDSRVTEYQKLKADGLFDADWKELVRWKYQCYMKDYMSCVAAVDDGIGEILKYLDESGLSENTIVIYASDQGFFLGEHGLIDKRYMYEESFRTPLIVRWNGVVQPGSINKDIVSNLDFAETFLDMAGTTVPKDMQGRSLVPILKGNTPEDWRKSFYYHYYEYPGWGVKKHEGVFDGRYKLIHFYDDIDEWELFDIQEDPKEMKNVIADSRYSEHRERLHEELERLRDEVDCPKPVVNTKSLIDTDSPTRESLIIRDLIEKRKSRQKVNTRALRLDKTETTDSDLKRIAVEYPNLVELTLSETKITDVGLAPLTKLTKLRKIRISKTAITDNAAQTLVQIPSLEDIDVSQTGFGNKGLKTLQSLAQLKRLNLYSTKISDEGLAVLKDFKSRTALVWLNIDKCTLNDAAIPFLFPLDNLEWLHLGRTHLTDKGLTELAKIKTLKEVSVTNTNVTLDGVIRFQSALPECKVNENVEEVQHAAP